MRVPGVKTATIASRRLVGRVRSGGVILGYHCVSSDGSWDPFDVRVGARRFAQQMEVLARFARPLPLDELVDARSTRARRARAVAVTFDDGCSECLTEVAPVLERHGVPATVFAISGELGGEPWWELLSRILSPSHELPAQIELEGLRLELGDAADTSKRRAAALELHRRLAARPPERRRAVVERLAESLGHDPHAPPEHRTLTPEELRALVGGGRMTVGSHGHRHAELAGLAPSEQQQEIATSKQLLEEILGEEISGFSYPHGSHDASAEREIRRAGFAYACASRPGAVLPSSDVFVLPRLWPPDVDGDRFQAWLHGWIGR